MLTAIRNGRSRWVALVALLCVPALVGVAFGMGGGLVRVGSNGIPNTIRKDIAIVGNSAAGPALTVTGGAGAAAGDAQFRVNNNAGTERLRVTADGRLQFANVGSLTISPGEVHYNGTALRTGRSQVINIALGAVGSSALSGGGGGSLDLGNAVTDSMLLQGPDTQGTVSVRARAAIVNDMFRVQRSDATNQMIVSPALPADGASALVVNVSGTLTESTGGTHPRLVGLEVTAPAITAGAAAVTDAASLYVSGAPAAAGAANVAAWVDGGQTRLDGDTIVGGNTATIETLANAGFVMGGDDLFVAGLLGVEGNIYTDGSLIVGATTTLADGSLTGSAAFSLLSGGAGDLTLDSASNKLVLASTDTTIERTISAATNFDLDLRDTSPAISNVGTFRLINSGAEAGDTANFNLVDGALQTAGIERISNAGAGTFASVALTSPLTVPNGGTGVATLASNGLLYGAGTGAVLVTAAGTSGQLPVASLTGVPTWSTMSGDATLASTGSLTIALNAVALAADTTGPFARAIVGGAGITDTAAEAEDATVTVSTASGESGFLADGGIIDLTCGAATAGRAQVMDNGTLQWCDGDAAAVLRRSALGDSAGAATGVACTDCVAMPSEVTGNYVGAIVGGAGITDTAAASEDASVTVSVNSSEASFLSTTAITCTIAGDVGRMSLGATTTFCDSSGLALRTHSTLETAQTYTGAKTYSAAIAANAGITFDNATDTVGAHTLAGTLDAALNIFTNIGNAGTDFVATTGALILAGLLTPNAGISLGTQSITGTTAAIDFSSFDVDSAGVVTCGAVTSSGNVAANGGSLTTTALTGNLFNAIATTLNVGGAATTVSLGAGTGTTTVNHALTATGTLTANGAAATNANLDGALDPTERWIITSNLTAARSVDGLQITQPNNATFNSTQSVAEFVNADTASTTAPVVNVDSVSGGLGIDILDVGSGSGLRIGPSGTGVTGGGGLRVMQGSAVTTGVGISIEGDAAFNSSFSGDLLRINPIHNSIAGDVFTLSGNWLDVARAPVADGAATVVTVNGTLARLTSTCSAINTGTCTDSGRVLDVEQNYASASGSLMRLVQAGSGAEIEFGSSTPIVRLTNTSSLVWDDGTNTLLTLADGGTAGNLTATGNVTANGNTFSGAGATTYDAGGAAAVVIGSADVTSLTVTTDGTGDAEVALPTGSIGAGEVLDDSLTASDLANTVCTYVVTATFNPTELGTTDDYVSLSAIDIATGDASFSTTEANEDQFRTGAVALNAHSLAVQVDVAPALVNDPWVITLRDDGGSTTLTCTISGLDTTCTDVANTPAITAASRLNMLVTSSGAGGDPTAAAEMTISFCLAP